MRRPISVRWCWIHCCAPTRRSRGSPTTTTPLANASSCRRSPSRTGRPRPPTCYVMSSALQRVPRSRSCCPPTGKPRPWCSVPGGWEPSWQSAPPRAPTSRCAPPTGYQKRSVRWWRSRSTRSAGRCRTCLLGSPTTPPQCGCRQTRSSQSAGPVPRSTVALSRMCWPLPWIPPPRMGFPAVTGCSPRPTGAPAHSSWTVCWRCSPSEPRWCRSPTPTRRTWQGVAAPRRSPGRC